MKWPLSDPGRQEDNPSQLTVVLRINPYADAPFIENLGCFRFALVPKWALLGIGIPAQKLRLCHRVDIPCMRMQEYKTGRTCR